MSLFISDVCRCFRWGTIDNRCPKYYDAVIQCAHMTDTIATLHLIGRFTESIQSCDSLDETYRVNSLILLKWLNDPNITYLGLQQHIDALLHRKSNVCNRWWEHLLQTGKMLSSKDFPDEFEHPWVDAINRAANKLFTNKHLELIYKVVL